MSARNPWMKFYPSDWRADPLLRMCSIGARGLWMEMIGLMHEAEPYGHLLISGRAPTDAQLAVLTGTPTDQLPALIGELEEAGVFSRTQKGVIYSRRMTRDEKKAKTAKKNGKSGGNPSLCYEREITASDNQQVKASVKGGDKAQKPEARSQIKTPLPPDTKTDPTPSPARQVALGFIRDRETTWPDESALPAPLMTLDAEAAQWLDAGYAVDALGAEIRRQMTAAVAKGRAAPRSIAAYRLSLQDALARLKGSATSAPPDVVYDPAGSQWRARLTGFAAGRKWLAMWGPSPDEPRCQAPAHIREEFPNIFKANKAKTEAA